MITEMFDWDEESREVDSLLSSLDEDSLDKLIDDILTREKNRNKKYPSNFDIMQMADKLNLPVDYVAEEFIIKGQLRNQ